MYDYIIQIINVLILVFSAINVYWSIKLSVKEITKIKVIEKRIIYTVSILIIAIILKNYLAAVLLGLSLIFLLKTLDNFLSLSE